LSHEFHNDFREFHLAVDFTHRNHYLSQEYQKGFADEDGKVWVFDRQTLKFLHLHPINVCVERDLYTTVDPDGKPQDLIEKGVFGFNEGKTWGVIEKLRQEAGSLSDEERAHLSLFVALMKFRTPVFDKQHDNTIELLTRWMAKAFNPTAEAVGERLSKSSGRERTQDDPEVQELFRMIHEDSYGIESPRQNAIKMMLTIAVELAHAIQQMDWTVLKGPADCRLVTSDNPFVVIPPPGHPHEILGFGPLTPGATSLFPLDMNRLLCLRMDGISPLRYRWADRDRIRLANTLSAGQSDRFIIARDEAHLRSIVKKTKVDQWRNEYSPVLISPELQTETHEPC
jgi:hypothetical protein